MKKAFLYAVGYVFSCYVCTYDVDFELVQLVLFSLNVLCFNAVDYTSMNYCLLLSIHDVNVNTR